MAKYIAVWDPLIRIGHWTIVLAFAVAYFSGEDLLSVHVWAGYIVGAVVLIRVIWGFIGPTRKRFTDFVLCPRCRSCLSWQPPSFSRLPVHRS